MQQRRPEGAGFLRQTYELRLRQDLSWEAFCVRHPLKAAGVALAVVQLPRVDVDLPDTSSGRFVAAQLRRPYWHVPHAVTGLAVLDLPAVPELYLRGRHRQAVRTNARRAERAGLRVGVVVDMAERLGLLELAVASERAHPDPYYRNEVPEVEDLETRDLWLRVDDAEGEPLGVAVVSVAGQTALLLYMRSIGHSPLHSDARHLLHVRLVEHLVRLGVQHLVDPVHPSVLPTGLRYFQQLTGFEYRRLVVRGTATQAAELRPVAASA